ncbi:T9SS type A sorting domain-containing protein, partial [uncultured Parabacteroides sp.]
PVPEITGEHRVPNGQYATFRASCSPLANASNWHWILNPVNGNTVYGANSQVLDVAFYNTGSYQVLARASNSYGTGEYTSFGLNVINSSSYSSIAYPNPASQTLYVDFTSIGDQPAQAFSSAAVQQKHYDVRLFNLQGSLVRTAQSAGERISLDVSGLPGGNYFLHIYDGKGEKPVVQQVIVSH